MAPIQIRCLLAERSPQTNKRVSKSNLSCDTKTKRVLKRKAGEEPKKDKNNAKAMKETRFDKYDHFAHHDGKPSASRCKNDTCNLKTNYFCRKCNLHLCLTKKRNCFYDYHHQPME